MLWDFSHGGGESMQASLGILASECTRLPFVDAEAKNDEPCVLHISLIPETQTYK